MKNLISAKNRGYILAETIAACMAAFLFAGAAASCIVMSAYIVRSNDEKLSLERAKRELIVELSSESGNLEIPNGPYVIEKTGVSGGCAKWRVSIDTVKGRRESFVFWPEN